MFDIPQQLIITRDNVEISVNPMIRYQVVDPVRCAYETKNFIYCSEKLGYFIYIYIYIWATET